MSRLDLLKKANTVQKDESAKSTRRSGMLDDKAQQKQLREKNITTDDFLSADDFKNELTPSALEDNNSNSDDIDKESVNVIEIDINDSEGINLESSFIEDIDDNTDKELDSNDKKTSDDIDDETVDIVEGNLGVNYSDADIKQELEYVFDHREDIYYLYIKVIKGGGMEINTSKILHLDDIVRISVTLTELKEQVGCEARIISAFPHNIRTAEKNDSNKYHYIVQFIGPNAPETDRVISKYLLGYKIK
ncbi:hypothetical protein FRA_34c06010 [Francisella sp. W12-1067]|nr:hypothetical protein FRA_34c06010 [Francisella sp. W12-1067]